MFVQFITDTTKVVY